MDTPPPNARLSIEWVLLPDGRPALAFDRPTWIIYEEMAAKHGKTAQQMITTSVAGCLGPILVDNDSRRR